MPGRGIGVGSDTRVMFTGIVQGCGAVAAVEPTGGDVRLRIETGALSLAGVERGESIAVNGACLTVVELTPEWFVADVSRETLECTTLGALEGGSPVNLERSLTPSTPLGGHLVTGHVDGVAEVTGRRSDGRSIRFELELPPALARYVAAKGSICLDGVSLTVNAVEGRRFSVNVIPHTAAVTTVGSWRVGSRVNVEVDLLARYLERLLGERARESGARMPAGG